MAQTIIPTGDIKAIRRYSAGLTVDQNIKSYWGKRFIDDSPNSIIQRKTEVESDAGDIIGFDLSVQLRNRPTTGDDRLDGKAEDLRFFTDEVRVDQTRNLVSAGGRMTRKRTIHDLRQVARDRSSDYWAKYLDELYFMYLSGARGVNPDFIEPTDYTGHAGNPFQVPDAAHQLFPTAALVKATVTTGDKMTKLIVERVQVYVQMIRANTPDAANMVPVMVDGEERFVLLMNPMQAFDMRTADTTGWMDVNKALITAEGKNNPIFRGGLGLLANTVLHSHLNCIRFTDYGAGTNVPAARALFMGRQAGVVAYGTAGGNRFQWHEEPKDHGNLVEISAGTIIGVKKTRFNSKDFGVVAIDTAAALPA